MPKVLNSFKHHLLNIPGWRTNRKIIVIESDDWGSIRMPSKEVYNLMMLSGIPVDKCPYNRYDSLASEDDLNALFNVLIKFKDINGNYPIITANTVVANPNFLKIKESGFTEYFYEPFTDTLKKSPKHINSFMLWKQGINEKLFFPQFHGREHVNVNQWLELLKAKNSIFLRAFENGFWGLVPPVVDNYNRINIQATFDAINKLQIDYNKSQINEGLILFNQIFGFRSRSFIANNYIWDSGLNQILKQNGVDILQGMKYQLCPLYNRRKREKIRHLLGEQNQFGQIHLIRNCTFEPSQSNNLNTVDLTLAEIANAFFWRKPAIISTHRLNFIGNIDQGNRDKTLKLFETLLKKILMKWKDVEFMTSVELADIIKKKEKI